MALRSVCSKEPGTFEAQSFEPLMEIRSVECGFTVSPCHHPMLGRVDRTKGRSRMLGAGFQFWSRLCSAGGLFNGLLNRKGDLKGSGTEHEFLLTLTYF